MGSRRTIGRSGGSRGAVIVAASILLAAACSSGAEGDGTAEAIGASTVLTSTSTSVPESGTAPDDPSPSIATSAPDADDAAADTATGDRPLQSWRQSMESLLGPVASMADPFEAAFSYFPDGIDPNPPGQLSFDDGRLEVQEESDGPFSQPGLDSLRIQATFGSDASYEALVDWMETTYPTGGEWEINASEDRSEDDERVMVYQVLRPGLDPSRTQLTTAIVEEDGEVTMQIDYSERDVQTTAPFEDLASITDALPRPLDAYPIEYTVHVNDLSVLYEARWSVRDVPAGDVARDLTVQFPTEELDLVTLPIFDDSTDYIMDVDCADTIFCTLRAQEASSDDLRVSTVWTLSYPHLDADG